MNIPRQRMNPVKIKTRALKNGWLGHGTYREADAYVAGFEDATDEALDWQNKICHDLIIYWLCEGVTER